MGTLVLADHGGPARWPSLCWPGPLPGYEADYNTFWAWALRAAEQGFSDFYAEGYFADYPPGGILLLWPLGKLAQLLQLSHTSAFARCPAGCARNPGRDRAGRPVLPPCRARPCARLFAGRCRRGQPCAFVCDRRVEADGYGVSVFSGGLLCRAGKATHPCGALCWGAALALKPQALILGPCWLCACWRAHGSNRGAAPRFAGPQAPERPPLCPCLCAACPFFGFSGLLAGLWEKYFSTAQSYPYASLSAANWFSLLGANWAPQENRMLFFTYAQWGVLHIALLTAGLCVLAFRAARAGRLCPLLLAAAYAAGIFCFAHRMHERYLLMAVFLTLAAAAVRANRQLLAIGYTLGTAAWLNMLLVVNASTSQDLFLLEGLPAFALRATALAVLLCVCALLWLAARLSLWPWQDEPCRPRICKILPLRWGFGCFLRAGPRAKSRRGYRQSLCAGQDASWPLFAARLRWARYPFAQPWQHAAPQTFVDAQGAAVTLTATVDGKPGKPDDISGHFTGRRAAARAGRPRP